MKLFICILLSMIISSVVVMPEDYSYEIPVTQLKMISGNGFKSPIWYQYQFGINNMCNLSFFNGRSYIPPYKDELTYNFKNKKKWAYLEITDNYLIVKDGSIPINKNGTVNYIAAGYPLLIMNGIKCKLKKSFFSRRHCSRTAIGIMPDHVTAILFISTNATLLDVQKYFSDLGCVAALNFDGGSSTFLYTNGQLIFSSKEGRTYPNVLYW